MSDFLITLAEITFTMSAVILLLLLLGPLLSRRYAVRWRYWAWLAVAVRLLIPINFSLPEAPVQLETPPDRVVYTAPPAVSTPAPISPAPAPTAGMPAPPAIAPPERTDPAPAARSLTLSQVLFWVWLTGALLLLLWHAVGYLRFRSYLHRWATPMEPPDFLPALTAELGVAGPVRLLACPGVDGPMMTGILRPTVLLPEGLPPEEDLWFILRHELTHFKRRDILYKALLLCANLVHWFNPLTWVLLRCAEGDLERCCDDDVVKGLPNADRARYGQIILDNLRAHR